MNYVLNNLENRKIAVIVNKNDEHYIEKIDFNIGDEKMFLRCI